MLNDEKFEIKSEQKSQSINIDDLMSGLNATGLNSNPKLNTKTEQVKPSRTDCIAE